MQLSKDLESRGLIKDKTFSSDDWLDKPKIFYLGIDASADSLTVGNLAILILARRLAAAGWKAVLLMGGGTSLVGDPGGKSKERDLLPRETVVANISQIEKQVKQLFSGQEFDLVDNYDWLNELKYLDLLRDVGKHFSMSELMQREFVTERLSTGISYAEFSYSLVQGYDYWHLYKNKKVVLQIGGSDQWGNMLSGVALIRKKEAKEVQAMSMPLITNKATGVKFGKSEDGAIWLDPAKTSPTQFYQFWINTDDADVEDYLKIYTFLTLDEISTIMNAHSQNPAARTAQTALAEAVTAIVHGESHGSSAATITAYLNGSRPLSNVTPDEIDEIREHIPVISSKAGEPLIKLLVDSRLASSNSEARRLMASNAIYINNQPVSHELLAAADFEGGLALIRRGKAYKDSALIIHE
jgi:tyrosyl-tRNA synthetase